MYTRDFETLFRLCWVALRGATGERRGEMAPSQDREVDLLLSKLRKIQVIGAGMGGGSDSIGVLL